MMQTEVPESRARFGHRWGLLGRVVDEKQEKFGIGDFVLRDVLATDPFRGTLTLSERISSGAIVQFHIRDERAAKLALTKSLARSQSHWRVGIYLNVRAEELFDTPNHDALAIADLCGNPPLGGILTTGEFGPMGGQNVDQRPERLDRSFFLSLEKRR